MLPVFKEIDYGTTLAQLTTDRVFNRRYPGDPFSVGPVVPAEERAVSTEPRFSDTEAEGRVTGTLFFPLARSWKRTSLRGAPRVPAKVE